MQSANIDEGNATSQETLSCKYSAPLSERTLLFITFCWAHPFDKFIHTYYLPTLNNMS
jgi:hypothetical protein